MKVEPGAPPGSPAGSFPVTAPPRGPGRGPALRARSQGPGHRPGRLRSPGGRPELGDLAVRAGKEPEPLVSGRPLDRLGDRQERGRHRGHRAHGFPAEAPDQVRRSGGGQAGHGGARDGRAQPGRPPRLALGSPPFPVSPSRSCTGPGRTRPGGRWPAPRPTPRAASPVRCRGVRAGSGGCGFEGTSHYAPDWGSFAGRPHATFHPGRGRGKLDLDGPGLPPARSRPPSRNGAPGTPAAGPSPR